MTLDTMMDQLGLAIPHLVGGLIFTLFMAAIGGIGGFILGIVLGVLRHDNPWKLGWLATLYIETIRSIPLILFLVFIHYAVMPMLVDRTNFLTSSLLAFTMFEAAYVAEIIRGGLRAIEPNERDAASSLGLTYFQQLRHIFLPLAITRTIPALVGQEITLIKDTSLASIVGVVELTRAGEIIYEREHNQLFILLIVATLYFGVCYTLSRFSQRFEGPRMGAEQLTLRAMQS